MKQKKKNLVVRLTPDQYEIVKECSDELDISPHAYVKFILLQHIKEKIQEKKKSDKQ